MYFAYKNSRINVESITPYVTNMKESMYCLQNVKVWKEYWKYVYDETIQFKESFKERKNLNCNIGLSRMSIS